MKQLSPIALYLFAYVVKGLVIYDNLRSMCCLGGPSSAAAAGSRGIIYMIYINNKRKK